MNRVFCFCFPEKDSPSWVTIVKLKEKIPSSLVKVPLESNGSWTGIPGYILDDQRLCRKGKIFISYYMA